MDLYRLPYLSLSLSLSSIHHMDLYRLPSGCDLSIIGIPEIFSTSICLIEWPQRMSVKDFPDSYIDVNILINKDQSRNLTVTAIGERWRENDRLFKIVVNDK
mmetsp:Transcript_8593/g.8720  ORF Transcript_8593/g.8720 Transcript_8593/m.8720 type:complete len:102 (-) Transcript_8593:16-321(-)